MSPLLEVNDLRVTLPTARGAAAALRDVSFTLQRGDTVGLIGESGCGKSLTALALMGLLPDGARVSGSIRFDGNELSTLGEDALCALRGARIGMIFQEPMTALNPVHTIGRQIGESLRLHQGLDAAAARAESLRLLERVQLPQAAKRLDAWPHQMSGGQRQRVVIAIALACGPELLIADEPTTALDVTIQREVLELIGELVAEDGMALLLISHDLGVMAENVDRLLVMYGGYELKLSRDLKLRVDGYIGEGRTILSQAQHMAHDVDSLRDKTFAAFDSKKGEEGEKLWTQVREESLKLDDLYARAGQSFEAAVTLDGTRQDARAQLGDVLYERALLAEREHNPGRLRDQIARLRLYDTDGSRQARWDAKATLELQVTPPSATVKVARYIEDKRQRLHLGPELQLPPSNKHTLPLERGSYLVTINAPGYAEVRYPVLLGRGEHYPVDLKMPKSEAIPQGFVYIPPGRFLFGTSEEETARKSFLSTVPSHQMRTSEIGRAHV